MLSAAVAANAARLDFRLLPQSAQPREWHQHGYNAQRTNYTPYSVEPPWRWQWSWNGSDERGAVAANKMRLPRCVQPVTGGGRIYVACGDEGVVAINPAPLNGMAAYDRGASVIRVTAGSAGNASVFILSTPCGRTAIRSSIGEKVSVLDVTNVSPGKYLWKIQGADNSIVTGDIEILK